MAGEFQKAFHKDEALPPSRKSVTKHYRNKIGKKVAVTFNIVVEPDRHLISDSVQVISLRTLKGIAVIMRIRDLLAEQY